MSDTCQPTRWEEDTSTLRRLAELVRHPHDADEGRSNLQPQPLLARLAFRGMLEAGCSDEEIAEAFGLRPERVRTLCRAARGT